MQEAVRNPVGFACVACGKATLIAAVRRAKSFYSEMYI